jgi:hypothetical protein
MEIDHVLDGTQVDYGYFWWSRKENERYKAVFPEGEFAIDLDGKRVSGKKVDWSMGRVYIGKKTMQELYRKDERVKISRQSSGLVVVRKLGGGPIVLQKAVGEHPMSIKLRQTQRDSDNPSQFEKAVAEAFSFLGFSTKHIGGRDEPDVLLEDIKAVIDSKTTKEGVISERYVNFEAMERYRDNHSASFLAVVAPGFSEGNIRDTATKKSVTLIETESICKLIENHAQYPYELALISAALFESEKTVISPSDIPTSITSQECLIELAARTLNVFKVSRRQSVSVSELLTFYELQGLQYSNADIERSLVFVSSPPFSILRVEGERYVLTADLETVMKKIGLLVKVHARFSGAL